MQDAAAKAAAKTAKRIGPAAWKASSSVQPKQAVLMDADDMAALQRLHPDVA